MIEQMLAMFFWQAADPLNSTAPLSPDPTLKKRIALISAQPPFGIATDRAQSGGLPRRRLTRR
jgi:hypothetical protein